MGELFELILGNPLLLILIIGGLISLFRREGDKNKQESDRRQQTGGQGESKKSSPFGEFFERMEEALSDDEEKTPTSSRTRSRTPSPSSHNEPAKQTLSAHDKRMEQMQQISDQIEAGTYDEAGGYLPSGADNPEHSGISDYSSREINVVRSDQTKRLRKQMKKRLHRKTLIDSVIMSEVLGEPRSKQPYQRRNMNKHQLY